MCSWRLHQHPSMVTLLLGVAFIAISNDLLQSQMVVQAWTYNYTTNPPMNWKSARDYCQQYFTDMVAIQNKAEIAYLNDFLPFNSGYYWIGIRKEEGKWTWVGTKKALSPEAENWATGEPNNLGTGQDCVEIYIKRQKDTAKWNDENCKKTKGAICYTASCSEESCSKYGDCVETIGDYRCQCHPGFEGPRCEDAVACGPVQDPKQGSMICLHAFGENRYNSSCQIQCNAGFQLQGAVQLVCLATGQWDKQTPSCQAVECPAVPDAPRGGSMNCSHPIATHSFKSTCEFRCDEGFRLEGAQRTECDSTGLWTHSAPTCKVVACEPLRVPTGVDFTCENPLGTSSYNSTCHFSCKEGHTLMGPSSLTCLASATWSVAVPVCEVVRCGQLSALHHGKLQCKDPLEKFSYSSTCWSECDSGFILKGSNSTHCSAQGQWSHALPVCQAVECPAVSSAAPSGGSVTCKHPIGPYSFTSTCEFRCDEGFLLQGVQRIECGHTGQWTHSAPICTVIPCGELKAPLHGKLQCHDPLEKFSYSSTCWSECDSGFTLMGSNSTYCSAQGQWTNAPPVCQVVGCDKLKAPAHGKLRCQDPLEKFSYNSTCWSECDSGFILKGSSSTQCSAQGQWSHALPVCQVVGCDKLKAPAHGKLQCQDPLEKFSYNSTCWSECDSGFILKGSSSTHCSAQGQWSHTLPVCQVVGCNKLKAPSHGKLRCQDPLEKFSYNSTCWSECDRGFMLKGNNSTQCSTKGQWSHTLPVCQVVTCPVMSDAPVGGGVNCSHPIAPHSFTSTCEFRCDEGFLLQGASRLECSQTGQWTNMAPTCKEREMSLGAAMIMYTSVGAASALGLLGLIGVALLARRLSKKASSSLDETLWNSGINPVFEEN